MTLFEQCVDAAAGESHPVYRTYYATITRAVLTCLRDNTMSPRTVDEIERVLGEA